MPIIQSSLKKKLLLYEEVILRAVLNESLMRPAILKKIAAAAVEFEDMCLYRETLENNLRKLLKRKMVRKSWNKDKSHYLYTTTKKGREYIESMDNFRLLLVQDDLL